MSDTTDNGYTEDSPLQTPHHENLKFYLVVIQFIFVLHNLTVTCLVIVFKLTYWLLRV